MHMVVSQNHSTHQYYIIIIITPPPVLCSHLFVEAEFIQLRENPAHAAISSTHQNTESHELLKQSKAGRSTKKKKLMESHD